MSKIIVIGGGISGFISAINAKDKNNEVLILERGNNPLKKLLLTGNGKCNYFNEDFSIKHYNSEDINILEKYITKENKVKVLDFYDKIGIIPNIKNGYYYPYSNQAITIKNAFLKEVEIRNIEIKTNSYVKDIKKENNLFKVILDDEIYFCDRLIISTGSSSYPKTGSDGNGYNLVKKLGHNVNEVLPALTALHVKESFIKDISGVRSNIKASLYENNKLIKVETGELQFTSYGLSGICIFNLSGIIAKGLKEDKKEEIHINFLNDLNIETKEDALLYLEKRDNLVEKRTISDHLDNILNYKITNTILKISNINKDEKYKDLTEEEKDNLANNLIDLKFSITNTNSFDNAQVCQGGVPLSEVTENFESVLVSNLYFTGEILDVCGKCGGYNIGFATLSGIIAGKSAGGNND